MVMGYSQDHPAIPSSQDHPSNGLSIPFSPKSHDSPLQSPRRLSPTADEPELDHNSYSASSLPKHSRSEDLNHSAPSSTLLSASRPNTPGSSSHDRNQPFSTSEHLSTSSRRLSAASGSSYSTSSSPTENRPPPSVTSASSATLVSTCSACALPMHGAFVRALSTVYHLQCFKCIDCGDVVASKFFPIDGPDGKQQPLCERDYFRRLNLICAKCGMALRGSYITACNRKFHVEHFTCSICPTLFGPQDSYYEHESDVYCHYHYSTRFATKCAGCNTAILKQFVEINRNMRDECWHPECYMINKFWNVKVVSRRPTSLIEVPPDTSESAYAGEERRETHASLKEKQIRMEQQVYRIWTVLSAFEESSAACISDMLRYVSSGQYLEAIQMAEKFILHVEVLFATIDDLEWHFGHLSIKGMSHVREARMLCRKTVDLFTLLSHTQETGTRRMGMTQELLALVTGLAHYLKILIRIALTGALKLEREHSVREAMQSFLDKLHLLAVQSGNPSARRMIKGAKGEVIPSQRSGSGNAGTNGVTYGFRSLAPENAGESPFGAPRDPGLSTIPVVNPPSDLCVKCSLTVEEDCCKSCRKDAAPPTAAAAAAAAAEDKAKEKEKAEEGSSAPRTTTARRPPANADVFAYELDSIVDTQSFGPVPTVILCTDHAHQGCRAGFQAVSRLEQYAFLLYLLLKKRKVISLTPTAAISSPDEVEHDPYRNSQDIMRMKSVHLDRKLSATAHIPKRSTIIESPSGKIAHPTDRRMQPPTTQHVDSGLASQGQRPTIHQNVQSTNTGPVRPPRPPQGLWQQQQQQQQQSPPSQQQAPQARPPRPTLNPPPLTPSPAAESRPDYFRKNTEVKIVDEPTPSHATRHCTRPIIAELTPLELAIVRHAAVVVLYRSPLHLGKWVEVKKQGFWGKLFKGNDKKNIKKKGLFGVPLELLVEREGADSLHGASRATLAVPSFIDDVISAMRQMDMSVEGIFRKTGNIRRRKELIVALDRDSTEHPVQIAALLKQFFRDLPDPLMTFKLHRLFHCNSRCVLRTPLPDYLSNDLCSTVGLQNDDDRKRLLHMLTLIMPKSHRDTLEVLLVFLKWVASFAHSLDDTGSKMDLLNLATVIGPEYSVYARPFGVIKVNQDEIFVIPEGLSTAGLDEKCEAYMRQKSSGRSTGPLMSPVSTSSPFNSNNANLAHLNRSGDLLDSRNGPSSGRSDRPNMSSLPGAQSEININVRNGFQSRQLSPQPNLPHAPASFPPPGTSSTSFSQGGMMIQTPQPRLPQPPPMPPSSNSDHHYHHHHQAPDRDVAEWTATGSQRPPQLPPLPPSSRPTSASFIRAGGGDLTPSSTPNYTPTPNGHGPVTPVQLRQRS
ncbi:RhoGAP domain containing protein [Russula decolorans]